jgi:hypothetical protein
MPCGFPGASTGFDWLLPLLPAESVPGGAQAAARGIEQDHGHQGDHGDRDRRREAEDQAASWSRVAPMAQIITAAAAQNSPR